MKETSQWLDLPDSSGWWWKCFSDSEPHAFEVKEQDLAIYRRHGDMRGDGVKIKYLKMKAPNRPAFQRRTIRGKEL